MSAVLLNLKEVDGREGRKYYQVSVDQDGEAGSMPITEQAYLDNKSIFKKYSPCTLTCEFNDQYKTCRVIALSQGLK